MHFGLKKLKKKTHKKCFQKTKNLFKDSTEVY